MSANALRVLPSLSVNAAPTSYALRGSTHRPGGASTSEREVVPTQKSFSEKVTSALLGLKVAVAQYAMHLPEVRRENIFRQLDNIINVEDWYEEDEFPSLRAFNDVLAWSIYADVPEWHSLGVDDEGDVLLAWHYDMVTLTANFDGNRLVRWTCRYASDDDRTSHAAGDCSLRQFAKQAKFYLNTVGD